MFFNPCCSQRLLTARSPMGSLLLQRRSAVVGKIPNKGYREQPPVPDRLKDTISYMGADPTSVHADDGESAYIPEGGRQRTIQEMMSNTTNMKSHSKLDRLRRVLDDVRNKEPGSKAWQEMYVFLRTSEMCAEVVRVDDDIFPKGTPLWIELQSCEERRVPCLMELENGMLVLPIFSMEEYMTEYFSRTDVYESCWFPMPRMGTCWESFCALQFPVCVTGTLQHFSTLATVALDGPQFGILLNPGQHSSKFITYPEMVELSKMMGTAARERNVKLVTTAEDGSVMRLFDENLMSVFGTEKMKMKRVEPHEVKEKLKKRPPLPPVAQLELHLLLYPYEELESVYVRTVDRPRWRQIMGASEKMTQIDLVVPSGARNGDKAYRRQRLQDMFEHIQRWSYMSEFNSDVHVEVAAATPANTPGNTSMLVYTAADGELLRQMAARKDTTLAEALGFRDPILDENKRDISTGAYLL